MRLLVTGATGFIGAPLCQRLVRDGHQLAVLTRSPEAQVPQPGMQVLSLHAVDWRHEMARAQGVINLAGASIAAARWTPRQQRLIRDSRVETTRRLVDAIAQARPRPAVLVSASAVGYYGPHGEEELTETAPPGRGFLAEVCQAWEAEAQRAEAVGVRVVRLRIGLVLGPGGVLARMSLPFRLWLGGAPGSGRQWVSWIHREDVLGLIVWALMRPDIVGAVNATAPQPVTMRAFCRELARALQRPSWCPVPGWALRLALGDMADLILTGQRVLPRLARERGYAFHWPTLPAAVSAALGT
jgi:uncharacterized protein (TIGR01777 family)